MTFTFTAARLFRRELFYQTLISLCNLLFAEIGEVKENWTIETETDEKIQQRANFWAQGKL
jgi:NTP pyrophosphatase (non-canonical NTP hydrolase)